MIRCINIVLVVMMAVVVAASTADTTPECVAPSCFVTYIANCLAPAGSGDDLIFHDCPISGGTWIHPPRTIPAMGSIKIVAKPAPFSKVIANCTYSYSKASRARNWTAFVDFEFQAWGGYAWGLGTNDVPDGEESVIGSDRSGNQCGWFIIPSIAPWAQCSIATNTTFCTIDKAAMAGAKQRVGRSWSAGDSGVLRSLP